MKRLMVLIVALVLVTSAVAVVSADPINVGGTSYVCSPINVGGTSTALSKVPAHAPAGGLRPGVVLLSPINVGGT